MVATVTQLVKVESGGVIRVQSPELHEGTMAKVVVWAEPPATKGPVVDSSWEAFIGIGAHTGRTVEQIDADLRELRDEWDR